jgi:uncharacterized protein YbbK (DUF523 family)
MKILVSACLLGEKCRFDGKSIQNDRVLEFCKNHEIIKICPEVMGGLPTPRTPSEIKNGRVINKEGKDVTSYFEKGANECLKLALDQKVDLVILKSRSPSCGNNEIYDGTFSGKLVKGKGVTAKLLSEHQFPIINEEEL